MNKLLFIRLALTVCLMGPLLSLASTGRHSSNLGVAVKPYISQTTSMCHAEIIQGTAKLLHSSTNFAMQGLFGYVCNTLTSTINLVVRIVSCAFLSVGSVLADTIEK